MFQLEMMPAAHGDCLWIEFGQGEDRGRILIDGGPPHTYPALHERISRLPVDQRIFELLVVTHVNADHIGGIVRLMRDALELNCRFKRIWYNGRPQLNAVPDPAGEPLGALQGEYLGLLIKDYEEHLGQSVWNKDLPDGIAGYDENAPTLPVVTLPHPSGDMRLTLLSPDFNKLLELKDKWRSELEDAGLMVASEDVLRDRLAEDRNLRPLEDVLGDEEDAGEDEWLEFPEPDEIDLTDFADVLGGEDAEFGTDDSPANGSSIALLLEYPANDPEVSFLLAGDAQPAVLEASLEQLQTERGRRLRVTGFKLPHHGSMGNLSPTLLEKFSCKHYLISTSGVIFHHPHKKSIDLLLEKHSGRGWPRLHFNYMTKTTMAWSSKEKQQEGKFKAFYPKGLSLKI